MVKSKDIFKKVSHAILVRVLKCINTRLKSSLFSKNGGQHQYFFWSGEGGRLTQGQIERVPKDIFEKVSHAIC